MQRDDQCQVLLLVTSVSPMQQVQAVIQRRRAPCIMKHCKSVYLRYDIDCLSNSDRYREQIHVFVYSHEHAWLHGRSQEVKDVVVLAPANGSLQI